MMKAHVRHTVIRAILPSSLRTVPFARVRSNAKPGPSSLSHHRQRCTHPRVTSKDSTGQKVFFTEDDDEMAWLEETAQLIKRQDWKKIDTERLAEVIVDLAQLERKLVQSQCKQVYVYLLYLKYRPEEFERNGQYWRDKIEISRDMISDLITQNTRHRINGKNGEMYEWACRKFSKETGADDRLPKEPPFDVEQLLEEDWYPVPEIFD